MREEIWLNAALTLIGTGVVGQLFVGIRNLRYRKQDKLQRNSDVIGASTSTVESVASAADSAADRYEAAMEKRFEMQERYYAEREKRIDAEANNHELEIRIQSLERWKEEADHLRNENARKIDGVQRLLTEMIGRANHAEHHICMNVDCHERKPILGTFNKDKNNG